DAGVDGETLLHLVDELCLGNSMWPLLARQEIDGDLHIVEAAHIGTVIGTANLGNRLDHFGKRAEVVPKTFGKIGGIVEGDILRQGGTNPEISFFQRRHEFAAYKKQRDERHQQECHGSCKHGPWMTKCPKQAFVVASA